MRDTVLRAANVELRGPDETQLVDELRQLAVAQGGTVAGQRLREYAREGSGHYVSTFVVSGVFQALATQAKAAAVAFLEAGLQLFPNSSALLTRLAEVELAKGDKAAAVAAFRRALTADPFNQYAGVQLKKLSGSSE